MINRTNKQIFLTPTEWTALKQLAMDLRLTVRGDGSVSKLMQAIANREVVIK
jgi:hypothetical protein